MSNDYKELILHRTETGPQGTFGWAEWDGKRYHSLELPWENNETGESCIPAGRYLVKWEYSPRFSPRYKKNYYRLQDTSPREGILIHPANWAGDTESGWYAELLGCIAFGLARTTLTPSPKPPRPQTNSLGKPWAPQKAISGSGPAIKSLEDFFGEDPYWIDIRNEW